MKAITILFAVWLLSLAASTTSASPKSELRTQTERLAVLLSDGYETFDPHSFATKSSRNSKYIAVFFTLRGQAKGNGSLQYLAFFVRNEELDPTPSNPSSHRLGAFSNIGARGERHFDLHTAIISGDTVTVKGMALGSNDAMCCPSIPLQSTFSIPQRYTG